jgi:ankyrin repeat protein
LCDCDRLEKNLENAKNTRTLIHIAAKHGENEILRYLLSEMHRKQLPLDLQDSNGNTAAHLAAKYNNLDCLQTLVEFNCNITIANKNGHSVSFVAEFYGNYDCVHYLMIVETCINLSIKLVRTSKKLGEYRRANEMLKCQMDEAIAINNDFINQRENSLNITLDLMKKQLNELESKFVREIERVQSENFKLLSKIDELKNANKTQDNLNNGKANFNPALEKEITANEISLNEKNCHKIMKEDHKRMNKIMKTFDELKMNLNQLNDSKAYNLNVKNESYSIQNNHSSEDKEHLEVLR